MDRERKYDESGQVVSAYTRRGLRIYREKTVRGDRVIYDSDFTLRYGRAGRKVRFHLPSTLADAIREADKIGAFLDLRSNTLDDAIKTFDPDRWAFKNPVARVCTVAELLEAHEKAEKALNLEERTAKGYRQSLVILFRDALVERRKRPVTDESIKDMALAEFTHRLVADFKVARVALAGEDRAEQERKKRSVNGVLRSVASLFSAQARQHYTHLILPEHLDDVLAKMQFRKVASIRKRLPSPDVICRLFSEVGELRKTDENAYLGFMLAAHAGLRLGEVVAARLDWIHDGKPPRIWVTIGSNFRAKGHDDRFVEIQPWLAAELRAVCGQRESVLTGHVTERKNWMPHRLNAWVKARGFAEADGEKGIHGLRFLFGAYLTNRKGLYVAKKFLGHASQATTEKHYADLMLDATLFDLWEKSPKWVAE